MKKLWVVAFIFAIISANAFAESVKPKADDIKPSECDGVAVDLINDHSDRLPLFGAGHKYNFYIGKFTKSEVDKLVITVEETRRKSHIEDDVAQLVTYFAKSVGEPIVEAPEVPKKICFAYTTAFKRSTIAVQVNSEPPINRSLIAGPEEHLSLSADLPINNVKQLTYDASSPSGVSPKDKPTSFYLGVNYKFGDVYTNYDYFDPHNFSGKLLFKASSSPNESMGVGIGYSFKFVELFVARVWTRDDVNTGKANLGTTPSTIRGISFNVSKGIAWLKGN